MIFLKKYFLILFILSLTSIFVFNLQIVKSITNTFNIFILNVFPSLFISLFFCDLLISSKFFSYLNFKFIPHIFRLNSKCFLPIILGYTSGYPSSAKAIENLYKDKEISKNEADVLLSFVNNANPLFIYSTIGITILGNYMIGTVLLISHILASLIIGIIYSRLIIPKNGVNLNVLPEKNYKRKKFSDLIKDSILNTSKTLMYILFYMIVFNILGDLINNLIFKLNISIPIITDIFEITKSITKIAELKNYSYISFLLGFSGLSIIFQIVSCFENYKINILKFISFKILQGILSSILCLLILNLIN